MAAAYGQGNAIDLLYRKQQAKDFLVWLSIKLSESFIGKL